MSKIQFPTADEAYAKTVITAELRSKREKLDKEYRDLQHQRWLDDEPKRIEAEKVARGEQCKINIESCINNGIFYTDCEGKGMVFRLSNHSQLSDDYTAEFIKETNQYDVKCSLRENGRCLLWRFDWNKKT